LRTNKPLNTPTMIEIVVIITAIVLFSWQAWLLVDKQVYLKLNGWVWFWAVLAGWQMLVTKLLRLPIAPGKWIDFTYVPIWVVVFTLPAAFSMLVLVFFTILIYSIFPAQFSCRKNLWTYAFHLSYQIILFYATIQGFWLVMNNVSWSIGGLSLTGTAAMFASMFALMFTDTLLGGSIQISQGQQHVWTEWKRDYIRITLVQTLLSSLAMLFTVLYLTGHPIQLTVVYIFFLMAIVIMCRTSFRQNDYMGLMRSMIALVELKDTYTKNHSESVGHYSMVLGQMLGFPASRLQSLSIAAQLHDVGKIGISDEVLKKEGPLTDEQYNEMKKHAAFGERVLQPIESLKHEAYVVGRHHEHMDGKGYPYRALIDKIPIEARIIGIADAYHAMISHRPYRRGLGVEEAIRRLEEGKGKQFDSKLVDLFIKYAKNPGKHTYRFRPFCLVH
jgi:HD-GYP domain-containing protein (c-di-GMP phosphodiesterase class II)